LKKKNLQNFVTLQTVEHPYTDNLSIENAAFDLASLAKIHCNLPIKIQIFHDHGLLHIDLYPSFRNLLNTRQNLFISHLADGGWLQYPLHPIKGAGQLKEPETMPIIDVIFAIKFVTKDRIAIFWEVCNV
jgi:hypothetical protein